MPTDDTVNNADPAQVAAATLIQRLWRGRTNHAKDEYMTPDLRWDDAAVNTKLAVVRAAASEGKNSPRQRWKRAAFLAVRLQDGNEMMGDSSDAQGVNAEDKQLESQHWLELVDGKHRYGSNLKYYHKRWQEEDTKDNFFKWLDHGGGKNLSLDECPRETLEKERIIYLSAEQRLNYLVKINEEGKLYWAKNNQPVDTTSGNWKDAGNGGGIIPQDMPQKPQKQPRFPSMRSVSSDSSAEQANAATHYAGEIKGKYRWTRYLRRHLTPRGIIERLLRKTVQRNTWIYVSDKNFNIFIGIKETGAFQHSTFTSGGLVTSAGLISVKHGVIHTLSPLSGHYRTSIEHFHQFIDVLTEKGVDMRKVKISKAEAALWGMEHIAKWKKAEGEMVKSAKENVKAAPKKATAVLTRKPQDPSWKRDVLQGRKQSDKKPKQPVQKEGPRSGQDVQEKDNPERKDEE